MAASAAAAPGPGATADAELPFVCVFPLAALALLFLQVWAFSWWYCGDDDTDVGNVIDRLAFPPQPRLRPEGAEDASKSGGVGQHAGQCADKRE